MTLYKRTGLVLLAGLLLVLAFVVSSPQVSAGSDWSPTADKIEDTLDKAMAAYETGDQESASQLAKDAYFEVFESSGLEIAIKLNISAQRAWEIEGGFAEIRQLIRSGGSPSEVQGEIDRLMVMIREDAERLGGGEDSFAGSFISSFTIIVREGFEAILILGAIIAYLIKSGNRDKVRTIYRAAILAVVASIITAIAVKYVFDISGASQELLEGATMLLAVAVLFSVSFWLLSKVQAEKWQNYIQSKVDSSLSTGNTMALWSAAFLAVYREGAEMVLFYQALLSGSESGEFGGIGLGFGVGVVVLVVIFVVIRLGSVRIPIKPFFVGTGILLYYLAFVFAGKGIRELQEAEKVGSSLINGLSPVEVLGFYPTWEGLALQLGLLLAAVLGLTYQFLLRPHLSGETEKAVTQ